MNIVSEYTFSPTSEDEVLKILKDINPEKAAAINNLAGMFLKDGAVVLALPISKLFNFLVNCSKLHFECKCQTQTIMQERFKKRSQKPIAPFHFTNYFKSYRESSP